MRPSVSGWLLDGALGSDSYMMRISMLYSQVGHEKDRLKISAGLRLKHTYAHGDFGGNTQQKDSSFTMNYFQLFPTIALQYGLTETSVSAVCSSMYYPPQLSGDLNPFLIYIFDDYIP